MQDVTTSFNARLQEVEQFIKFVRLMQQRNAVAKLGLRQGQENFLPMLKACVFLLLYNAIESCVRSAFADFYEQIKSSNTTFNGTTNSLQQIWLTQQLDARVSPSSSNRNTYLTAVSIIAEHIAASGALELNSRDLPISGNLNADKIRDLCSKHGIDLKTPTWAKGGGELDTIKSKRNALAHGHVSFVECGREYDLNDLKRMHKQTKHFMHGLLKSLAKYANAGKYKIA